MIQVNLSACYLPAPAAIDVTLMKRQSGRRKSRKGRYPVCSVYSRPADQSLATKAASDNDDCNLVIGVGAMAPTLQDQTLVDREDLCRRLENLSHNLEKAVAMLMALSNHMGIDPLLIPGFNDNPTITPTLTHSMDPLPVTRFSSHNNVGGEDEIPSQVCRSPMRYFAGHDHDLFALIQV